MTIVYHSLITIPLSNGLNIRTSSNNDFIIEITDKCVLLNGIDILNNKNYNIYNYGNSVFIKHDHAIKNI